MVQGDTWEDIRKQALAEGATAFPSAKAITLEFPANGPLKRRADWTREYDFGGDPKKYFIEDVYVRGWSDVDEKSST